MIWLCSCEPVRQNRVRVQGRALGTVSTARSGTLERLKLWTRKQVGAIQGALTTVAVFASARLTLWQFDKAGHLRLTWIVFAIAAGLLMGWRLLRFATSARRHENGWSRIESALRERSTIFTYSLTALGSLALVAFAYLQEAPPFPLCLSTAVSTPSALTSITTGTATATPPQSLVATNTPSATPSPSGGGQVGLVSATAVPCVAATSVITGAAATPEANTAGTAAPPHQPAPGEITSEDAARRRWSGFKDWLPEDLHGLALYAVWFGALGGVAASLKGIYDHANDWDKSNALWHYGRPFSAAVVGGVTYVLLLVASAQNQTALATPAILAVAFALGTQDKRFFSLLYEMTRLVVGSPDDKKEEALSIGTVQPDTAPPHDDIAILGASFATGARLYIGGVDAEGPVSVADDGTRISAKVPAPAGDTPPKVPVDVTVVNPNGVAYVKTAAFTYQPIRTPAASNLAAIVPTVLSAVLKAFEDAGETLPAELPPDLERAIHTRVSEAVAALPPSEGAEQAGETVTDQMIEIIKATWSAISSEQARPIRDELLTRLLEFVAQRLREPEDAG
jgi:hypothetical protein